MEIYILYEACQVSGDQSVRDRNLSTVCLIGIAETSSTVWSLDYMPVQLWHYVVRAPLTKVANPRREQILL